MLKSGSRPKIIVMIRERTAENVIDSMKRAARQGAEGFCLLLESLEKSEKTEANYKRIIAAAEGRTTYVTNYARNNSEEAIDDDTLAEQLLSMAKCGADIVDVRADTFHSEKDELTFDPTAVKKQKELIKTIHGMGALVIMSTHIFEYKSSNEVLKIALEQKARGADIAKIVTFTESDREADEAIETNLLLKAELGIPFLFLTSGSYSRRHRLLSPTLGSYMSLCVENSNTGGPQPTIEEAIKLSNLFGG